VHFKRFSQTTVALAKPLFSSSVELYFPGTGQVESCDVLFSSKLQNFGGSETSTAKLLKLSIEERQSTEFWKQGAKDGDKFLNGSVQFLEGLAKA
jgi:hypothetical protein